MKKKIIFLVLLTLIVFLPKNVKADCSDAEIIRLQKLANNVNINYTYNSKTDSFDIIITNLKKDLILKDYYTHKTYNIDKEIILRNETSGEHKYYIYAKNKTCDKDALITKHISIPFYNDFSNYSECDKYENKTYCQKWLKSPLTYEMWKNKIKEYNSKEQIIENKKEISEFDKYLEIIKNVYVKYYYIILPSIITVLAIIIYIKNKKESLI